MSGNRWKILIIEDQNSLACAAQGAINDFFEDKSDIEIEVSIENNFDNGISLVSGGEYDLVILDVRRDRTDEMEEDLEAGVNVFRRIQEVYFAPVIFWTALPSEVSQESMEPLVAVVQKDDTDKLLECIENAINSQAVDMIANVESQVASELKDYMWKELAPNWNEYMHNGDSVAVAQVLIGRLARVLTENQEGGITSHPSHRYIYPPASDRRGPGDVMWVQDTEACEWWLVLTPACDLAQRKCDLILLAKADPLEQHPKYIAWKESESKSRWNNLTQDVLTSTNGRYYYLPAFRQIPDLVVDLANVKSIGADELEGMTRIASLASPFSEAILTQHSHYRGRVGVPDFDLELIEKRVKGHVVKNH